MANADRTPSDTLMKSKVWTEGYAEEGDSGVVALDKSRLPVLMGLLHICWQNTVSVRQEWTYRITYGDKESWWFGMELSNVPYVFEEHYAAILGETSLFEGDQKAVCSFCITHVDEKDKLLWSNGSLLKNKAANLTDFQNSDSWMIDGLWLKGASKQDVSCMRHGKIQTLDEETSKILRDSVVLAQQIDQKALDKGIDVIADSQMHF